MANKLRSWGYTEEEIHDTMDLYQWSERLGKWLCIECLGSWPVPPNAVPGYTHGQDHPDLYTKFRG